MAVDFETFDVYGVLRKARVNADATRAGFKKRDGYRITLSRYPSLSGAQIDEVAIGEALEAERTSLLENRGRLRDTYGLGQGLTAILIGDGEFKKEVEKRFVPNPPKLGGPEVEDVLLNGDGFVGVGLHLPNGTFAVYENRGGDTEVYLYGRSYIDNKGYIQPAGRGAIFQLTEVCHVSDAGGGAWENFSVIPSTD